MHCVMWDHRVRGGTFSSKQLLPFGFAAREAYLEPLLIPFSAGTDFRRQNLTSTVGPRTEII